MDKWKINDQLSFSLAQTEGVYKILDFNSKFFVFAKMDGVPCSPLTRGTVTQLRKTEWKGTIKQVDCAICNGNSAIKRDHEQHEVVIPEHGVYVTPSHWTFDHEISLIVDSGSRKRYLFDHTIGDAIKLS